MPIVKTNLQVPFARIRSNKWFMADITIYARATTLKEFGNEDVKEHLLQKLDYQRAETLDKRITIHLLPNTLVYVCDVKTHIDAKPTKKNK